MYRAGRGPRSYAIVEEGYLECNGEYNEGAWAIGNEEDEEAFCPHDEANMVDLYNEEHDTFYGRGVQGR